MRMLKLRTLFIFRGLQALGIACFLCNPVTGQISGQGSPTVEQRLQALELKVQRLAKENADLRMQLQDEQQSFPRPLQVNPTGKESKLMVGGFLQGQAEFGHAVDPRWSGIPDRLFFRRARIYVGGGFAENFEFKAEIDLQGNTLGAGTAHMTRANEIYINWSKYEQANLRFGQLKPAFGVEALTSDTKLLTIERSLSSDRLADGRQLAASIAGVLPNKQLRYLAVVAQGNGSNVSANDNRKFQKSLRVEYTPWSHPHSSLILGANGLWTEDNSIGKVGFGFAGNRFAGEREMLGIDVQWMHAPVNINAEWLQGTFKPVGAVPADRFKAQGWHATAAYSVIPGKLQLVWREESFDPNTSVHGDAFNTTTLGLNYYLKGDDIKLMIDYLTGDPPGGNGKAERLLGRIQLVF